MQFFKTINGIPIHISDTLKGEKSVVLLHGYLETLYVWDEFVSSLADFYRVITIDIPGHGLSGTFQTNSMAVCADIVDQLLSHLQIEKAVVIGHSMGGYIAIEAIKRYPNRFVGLIMMHSSPFADSEQKRAERMREIELIKHDKLQNIARLSIPKMFASQNIKKFADKIGEIVELTQLHDSNGVIALINGMMEREENSSFIRETETPVFMIFGIHDNYIPKESAESFISTVKDPNFYFLDNSGHTGFIEEPVLTLELCKNFINKVLP